jgi:chaperone required for assembly of F1-ATPase
MKRFWREVTVAAENGGWRVLLDSRPIRTQGGAPQVVAGRALAEALADEWRGQGEEVDPSAFPLRDLADHAIDIVAPDRDTAIAKLLAFAETDTLYYRADPDEPLARRQRELWEPLLKRLEAAHALRFERVSGILHRPQPPATLETLRRLLEQHDAFTLSGLASMASLAASLVVALAALEPEADAEDLWAAANLEEDWQAEHWGWEAEASERRVRRLFAFAAALRFAALARG